MRIRTAKVEGVIWTILFLMLLAITVMKPRIIFGIVTIVCLANADSCFRAMREKSVGKMLLRMAGNIVILVSVCYMGQFLNLMFPYHASYEYERDIEDLKNKDPEVYACFPDALPDSATKVKWICHPLWEEHYTGNPRLGVANEAAGTHHLFFYADEDCLQQVYEDAASQTNFVYTYEEYIKYSQKDQRKFLEESKISRQERENVSFFIFYRNKRRPIHRISGIYINFEGGYVGFFNQ